APLHFLETPQAAQDYLNYGMPEIVIMDFSDPGLDAFALLTQMAQDPFLHAFGIVGLYRRDMHNEKELLQRLAPVNLVNLIEAGNLPGNLSKTLCIVEENRQIVFQRDLSHRFFGRLAGTFEIDNDLNSVSCYSNLLVICLSNSGYVDDSRKVGLTVSLTELILNGIEHGNCRITYEEKSEFLRDNPDIADLIALRCRDPEVMRRRVRLEYDITPSQARFVITDEGKGFDPHALHNPLDNENLARVHGRGIFMARHFADSLTYNEKGNAVTLLLRYAKDMTRFIPQGFRNQEELVVPPGGPVFREGEASDFLYYVVSGSLSVTHNGSEVGRVTPGDLFVGEMSFLLDNRRSATVTAETESKLIKISKEAFVSAIRNYPHYGLFLSRLLAEKLVKANEIIAARAGAKML
ncbi:MAG: cyclic nucleotide-binding domain-containing protein, partial [Fibrobacterota bacterium]